VWNERGSSGVGGGDEPCSLYIAFYYFVSCVDKAGHLISPCFFHLLRNTIVVAQE